MTVWIVFALKQNETVHVQIWSENEHCWLKKFYGFFFCNNKICYAGNESARLDIIKVNSLLRGANHFGYIKNFIGLTSFNVLAHKSWMNCLTGKNLTTKQKKNKWKISISFVNSIVWITSFAIKIKTSVS